jgi:hypothetical protein
MCLNMMPFRLVFVLCIFLIESCAHIPQESIQLSEEIGKGIADQNRAYINLLNEYFSVKRKAIDAFITESYAPVVFSSIRTKMKAEGISEIPDTISQMIVKRIVAKRDSMQSSLEQVRISILTTAQENATLLSNANTAVTSLLSSAVSVDKSTKKILLSADSLTGSKFKFAEFEKTFDQYLNKVGTGTAKANDLYEQVNQISTGGK